MKKASFLVLAALAAPGLVGSSGCDPAIESTSLACSSAADCPLGSTCDPRIGRCAVEPEGGLIGQISCQVFDQVVPPESPSTTDLVGVLDGVRVKLQGAARCFASSIYIDSAPATDGTITRLTLVLPEGFRGGTLDLGPDNAWFTYLGGGRDQREIAYGMGRGLVEVKGDYAVGAQVSATLLLEPTRACGLSGGAFCPGNQRCAALFSLEVKAGICTSAPETVSSCSRQVDCPVGSNCIYGACRSLCRSRGPDDCASGEACFAVENASFQATRTGACASAGVVAKVGAPCGGDTYCEFASVCADLGAGSVCVETCQTDLACSSANGFRCTALPGGQGVCAQNVVDAGESCEAARCGLDSVCLNDDNLCHEYCNPGNDTCPPERPECVSLKSGNFACAAP